MPSFEEAFHAAPESGELPEVVLSAANKTDAQLVDLHKTGTRGGLIFLPRYFQLCKSHGRQIKKTRVCQATPRTRYRTFSSIMHEAHDGYCSLAMLRKEDIDPRQRCIQHSTRTGERTHYHWYRGSYRQARIEAKKDGYKSEVESVWVLLPWNTINDLCR